MAYTEHGDQATGVEYTTEIWDVPDPSVQKSGTAFNAPRPKPVRTVTVQYRPYRIQEDGNDYLASTISVTTDLL